jgi:hypothetical protein
MTVQDLINELSRLEPASNVFMELYNGSIISGFEVVQAKIVSGTTADGSLVHMRVLDDPDARVAAILRLAD